MSTPDNTSTGRRYTFEEFMLIKHPAIVHNHAYNERLRCMFDNDNPFMLEACRAIIALPSMADERRVIEFLDRLVDAYAIVQHAALLAKTRESKAKRARDENVKSEPSGCD